MELTEGHLLRIFVGEADRHDGKPVYEWIVAQARRRGLAGATVLRGTLGFGATSRIHSSKILRLSEDLPMVVEIVDEKQKIESFLDEINPAITGGLATIERVQIHFYRGDDTK